MKKLSITLLALALALVFTVPAMAIHVGEADAPDGALGVTGRYQFDGEAKDVDGTKSDFYDDDLDIQLVLEMGDVKAQVSLEMADTNPFEGTANKSPVDNYYIQWAAMDNLDLKIGEYGLSFARTIGTDAAGARNIQATYSMDALSISGAIIVEDDGSNAKDVAGIPAPANSWDPAYAGTITVGPTDDDNNTLYLKLSAKEAGPFTKLDLVSYTQMNDVTSAQANTAGGFDDLSAGENSYTGVDLALPIGPVDLAFEYGANGGDIDGTFMLVEIGLEDLVGFDLGVNYFASSDDYLAAYDENAWSPMTIFGDNINEGCYDMTAIWVDASYAVNDKLTVTGQVLVSAENDAGDEYGTEVDVGLKYKIADNVSYAAAYGTYSEGDGVAVPTYKGKASGVDKDYTELWHRIQFTF
jgi:hypothetical protein